MADLLKRLDEAMLAEGPRKYYGGTEGANVYYWNILKPFVGKNIGAWSFEEDPMVGTFSFNKGDIAVYGTPFWEGADGIAVQYSDYEGDGSDDFTATTPIGITGDSKKDSDTYFKIMTKVLKRIK